MEVTSPPPLLRVYRVPVTNVPLMIPQATPNRAVLLAVPSRSPPCSIFSTAAAHTLLRSVVKLVLTRGMPPLNVPSKRNALPLMVLVAPETAARRASMRSARWIATSGPVISFISPASTHLSSAPDGTACTSDF